MASSSFETDLRFHDALTCSITTRPEVADKIYHQLQHGVFKVSFGVGVDFNV